MSNVDKLLKEFEGKMTRDFLFEVVNLEHDEDKRLPVLVPGNLVEGLIINKHYLVKFAGENEGTKQELEEKRVKETVKASKEAIKNVKLKEVKGE